MEPISERAKRALEDHRATTGFGPGRKEALLERLEHSIAAGEAESFVAELDQSGEGIPAAGGRARTWGVTAALVLAAGLAGFWWVSTEVATEQAREPVQQAAYAEQEKSGAAEDARLRQPVESPAPSVEERGDPIPPAPSEAEAEPTRSVAQGSRPRKKAAPAAEHAEPDLAAELSLLRKARAELAAGKVESALRQVDRHADEFPKGQLRQERDALRVEILCALDPSRGKKNQAAFLRRHPSSSHAERVRGLTCGSDE